MIYLGVDIGSLTAKAVLLKDDKILGHAIIRDKSTPLKSADAVCSELLETVGLSMKDVTRCCSTGYGRFDIPFSHMNKSEISCHGMGAFWTDPTIRGIIDIGGQDCKVVSIDQSGMVNDFVMNEKCAAGTGRCLELLAKNIGITMEQLGPRAMEAKKSKATITNKCSVFMELEVFRLLHTKTPASQIAWAINDAVARRVANMFKGVKISGNVCMTGGVAKNIGVVKCLESHIAVNFTPLKVDAQIMGALGAAVFASKSTQSPV